MASLFKSTISTTLIGGLAAAGLTYAWVTYCESGRKFAEKYDDPCKVYAVAGIIGAAIGYLMGTSSQPTEDILVPPSLPVADPETFEDAAEGMPEGGAEEADPQAYGADHLESLKEPFM
jgi:hypothetical protein